MVEQRQDIQTQQTPMQQSLFPVKSSAISAAPGKGIERHFDVSFVVDRFQFRYPPNFNEGDHGESTIRTEN